MANTPSYAPGTGAAATMAAMTGHGESPDAVDSVARLAASSAHSRLDAHDASRDEHASRLAQLEADAGPAEDAEPSNDQPGDS